MPLAFTVGMIPPAKDSVLEVDPNRSGTSFKLYDSEGRTSVFIKEFAVFLEKFVEGHAPLDISNFTDFLKTIGPDISTLFTLGPGEHRFVHLFRNCIYLYVACHGRVGIHDNDLNKHFIVVPLEPTQHGMIDGFPKLMDPGIQFLIVDHLHLPE